MNALTAAVAPLAAPLAVPFAVDASNIGPGLGAFAVVSAIAVATFFLIRSMNRHLKKINFEEKPPPTQRPGERRGPDRRGPDRRGRGGEP